MYIYSTMIEHSVILLYTFFTTAIVCMSLVLGALLIVCISRGTNRSLPARVLTSYAIRRHNYIAFSYVTSLYFVLLSITAVASSASLATHVPGMSNIQMVSVSFRNISTCIICMYVRMIDLEVYRTCVHLSPSHLV